MVRKTQLEDLDCYTVTCSPPYAQHPAPGMLVAAQCLSVGNGEPPCGLEQESDFKNTPTPTGSAALSLLRENQKKCLIQQELRSFFKKKNSQDSILILSLLSPFVASVSLACNELRVGIR